MRNPKQQNGCEPRTPSVHWKFDEAPSSAKLMPMSVGRIVSFAVLACLWVTLPFPRLIGAVPEPSPPSDVDLSAHVAALRKRIPSDFTVVIQRPFVVWGDEPASVVQRRAANTVKWAVDKLKQDYFKRDPAEIIDIWLFKDGASYTNHASEFFNDQPTTRFGYYSAAHHALIMNISTGGGTLVHEIVHPFMRANFSECPPWFNEGLASLYEASSEKDGHIRGMINWRFKGLEQAIKARKTISFERLMAMDETQFYGRDLGTPYNQFYAQARYLCYYLQEEGLLVKFYREFVANAQTDPTGFATLKKVTGESDAVAFQKKWEKFILALRSGGDN